MKLPFWATIFTIISVMVLCGLGIWQMQRLAWKNDLFSRIKAEFVIDAATVNIDPSVDLSEALVKRGFLKGVYVHEDAILIQARTYKGQQGYHLVTPFRLTDHDNKTIFVNRGWIPLVLGPMSAEIKKPLGVIRITGVLRPTTEYNSFVPQNDPDKDQWYRVNPAEIAKAKNVSSFYKSNIFYKDLRAKKRGVPDLPIPQGAEISVSNNHAGYALFWFVMAIAMVVIYGLRFIAPQFRTKF